MGELEGKKGVWAYVKGGMGAVSEAIASCAKSYGAEIFTDSEVESIMVQNGKTKGIALKDGTEIQSRFVLSNATPKVTFLDLLDQVRCLKPLLLFCCS